MLGRISYFKERGELKVDSDAGKHMMSKGDLTPEERDTIQRRHPLAEIMTTDGTAHTDGC